ncbi:PQQ-binding-like beta-propeller repeat protein, partial [Candidatus Poribacteria bacterium]|nr:PQQ-binding-like beta-propeller repeat protein [Candidatus Poribacteria bacterium]
MKKTLLFFTLLIVSTFSLSTAFAQYEPYMQVGLPEGSKARFGQSMPLGIFYSSNIADAWIAVESKIGLWIYDADTLQVRDLFTITPYDRKTMLSSPDGSTLAVGFSDGTVKLWEVATGAVRKTFTGYPAYAPSMCFSPDGSILAIGGQGGVYLWDVATGTGHSASTGHSAAFWLHFSPDGDTLTTHTEDNNVHLWDVATGTLRYTFDTAT